MNPAIIWFVAVLVILGWVGGMEVRYHEQAQEQHRQIQQNQDKLNKALDRADRLEQDIAEYRLALAAECGVAVSREEYFEALVEYLAADGRCRVRVERNEIDWESWGKKYHGQDNR